MPNNEIREFWVRHMSLVLSNDQGTYEYIRDAIQQRLEDGLDVDEPTRWDYVGAAGDACEEVILELVAFDLVANPGDSVSSMLLNEFLGMGTDAYRELATHFYELSDYVKDES